MSDTEPTLSSSPPACAWPILAVAGVPLLCTLFFTSELTPLGEQVYIYLGSAATALGFLISAALLLALSCYLLDVHTWTKRKYLVDFLLLVLFALSVAVLLCCTLWAPSIPIIFGTGLSVAAVAALRYTYLGDVDMELYSSTVSFIYTCLAVLMTSYWMIWALTPLAGGYHKPWLSNTLTHAGFSPLTVYVLWGSPLIISLLCGIVAAATYARGKVRLPQNPDEPLDEVSAHFVKGELRIGVCFLAIGFATMWVAATLISQDIGLSKTVVRLGVALMIGFAVFAYSVIGPKRMKKAVGQNSAAQSSVELLRSEWVQGFTLMFLWPFLPIFFFLEFVHQQFRNLLSGEDFAWISKEAYSVIAFTEHLHMGSVLVKSVYSAAVTFTLVVTCGPFLTVGLVWLHETIVVWSLYLVLLVLLAVALLMFSLPPVPGAPIYLLAGEIIVEKGAAMGMSFGTSCCIAVVFSFFCKMAGSVFQKEAIGLQLSENVSVKTTIGVQTAAMKAIRHILSQKGLSWSKVAILTGGPDWPTFVLTGVMRLSLFETFLGSTPVFFVVAPFALTAAFATESRRLVDPDEQRLFEYISLVLAMVASVVLTLAMAFAGYYIQSVMDEFKKEIEGGDWEKDPQEAEVLEKVQAAQEAQDAFNKQTAWEVLPPGIRLLLVGGSIFGSIATYLLLVPLGDTPALQEFGLEDTLSDLQGGLLGLLNPIGWICLYIVGALCLVLVVFETWYSLIESATSEASPLLHPGSKKSSAPV